MLRTLVMSVVLGASVASYAAEPSYTFLPDGTLEARLTIDAPVGDLRAVLANTATRQDLSKDIFSIAEREPNGRCNKLETKTRGMWRPLRVLSVFCSTDRGFKETMDTGSEDFTEYFVEWDFTPDGNQTHVVYRSRTVPNLPVPASLLREKQKGGVQGMFDRLVDRLRAD